MEQEEIPKKRLIVIVAMTGNMLLDFAGPADVFNNANKFLESSDTRIGYDVRIVAPSADRTLATSSGISIACLQCAKDIDTPIDTLIIAGNEFRESHQNALTEFYKWLESRNESNTRRIASVCGGAFVLAKAGILKGRKATTHWELSEKLSKEYPDIDVDANPFFTNDGPVFTSAGVTSGIDLSLAMIEQDHTKELSILVARKLVFYLKRPGFQSQFGNLLPIYQREHIGLKTQNWINEHLFEKMEVSDIAEHMNMSTRNFTRVFHRETGMPPAKFVEKIRVEAARKYLETADISIERISELCGLGGLVSMRRVFLRHLNTTPSDYRRAFRTPSQDFEIESLSASD
jgi:transcriptional regulator GlxA family with amidase domain